MVNEVGKERAREIIRGAQNRGDFENFCQHPTVKILDIEPATERKQCSYYRDAIIIVPNARLESGREYSLDEIEKIGYKIYHISRYKNPKYSIEKHLK